MLSRRGICYDLEKSHYRSTQKNLVYVFSSQLHMERFEEKLNENRETINKSLTKRFNVSIDVSTLADLVLYKKIETRGFLVVIKDETSCQEKYAGKRPQKVRSQATTLGSLQFVGGNVTLSSSNVK